MFCLNKYQYSTQVFAYKNAKNPRLQESQKHSWLQPHQNFKIYICEFRIKGRTGLSGSPRYCVPIKERRIGLCNVEGIPSLADRANRIRIVIVFTC